MLGIGIDIEDINRFKKYSLKIENLENGKPTLICKKFSNYKYLVSLSHEKEKAIAIVYINEV